MIALQQCEISSISISPNFENWFSETLQNDSILLFADNHNFTMVEDNFENKISKTLQIDLILLGWG